MNKEANVMKPSDNTFFFSPRTDVYSEGDNLVLESEMPGLDKSNIEIQLENHVLSFKALGGLKKSCRSSRQYQVGYERRFQLQSNFDGSKAAAEYNNGVLRISIPKAEHEKAKKVAIA